VAQRPALFLDRDGVINVDHGYVHRIEDVQFVDGIFDLVRHARAADHAVCVITNQAGIARGYYTEADFAHLTDWMRARFAAEGAPLDAVYFCPDHPEHGLGRYKRDTPMRKPGPGMILQAQREHDIDLARSVLVGDRVSDIEAGAHAGVGCLLFFDPTGRADGALAPSATVVTHLLDVRRFIGRPGAK
jgi:D-glycero-D-manno-heptose 1,7-bisphosphate phosphatase